MNERLTHALASAKETRACVIGQGVLNETPALLREQFGDKKALVIADTNTFKAAGAHVQEVLKAAVGRARFAETAAMQRHCTAIS